MNPVVRIAVRVGLTICCASLPAWGVERTNTFQQDLEGYVGVQDTFVSLEDWANPPQYLLNYGLSETLVLSRNGYNKPLLRIDLSAITSNSVVSSAALWLSNTQPSSLSGTRNFTRLIELHRVLRAWDEGNQAGSAIDQPGDHGATGSNSFAFYPGEGSNVLWAAPGMAPGVDYAEQSESETGVVNPGWYQWDLTALVQAWVRGQTPNFGLVLVDATGYQDDHSDSRTFVSSQGTTASQRPRLVVVFNPETPTADAGPDQENLQWTGTPFTLDGSGSHDRPGGNDATLAFTWRVTRAAYGSVLLGRIVGTSKVSGFTPDTAGDYELELAVTNTVAEGATDRLKLRVWSIGAHPRIYLSGARLAALQAQAVNGNPRWDQLAAEAATPGGDMLAKAFVGLLKGSPSLQDEAIAMALSLTVSNQNNQIERHRDQPGQVALVYDWCWGRLSAAQKSTLINYFNFWGPLHTLPDAINSDDIPTWGNYPPRFALSYALMGLATLGENAQAARWLSEFRDTRFELADRPMLDRLVGGAWPEGTVYDCIANYSRVLVAAAWLSGTGEDLFSSTVWYQDHLTYLLMARYPGVEVDLGAYVFHPCPSIGDAERHRGGLAGIERLMGLVLLDRFAATPAARQYQAYLAAMPSDAQNSYFPLDEFLWFHLERPGEAPSLLTHYAPGTGTVMIRSGWPSGAADTNSDVTHIRFQCGDHFTYHQHFDQNSFTLFKDADLAVESGVYSGEATSWHDVNYYARTIAHNTLVVYNPLENFSAARPDATANDGGQRSFTPASRSPPGVAYWDRNRVYYDTGEMLRFEDDPHHVYALGDATMAYNNTVFNQAMDGVLLDNVAKLTRFHREFVYLRSAPDVAAAATNDFVVLFDRVGVTQTNFSGQNTKLLFHTLSEPAVSGTPSPVSSGETLFPQASEAKSDSGPARLVMRFLLPSQRNIRKVGGRGLKAFWVFDANYDWHWSDTEPQPRPISDFESEPYGEWRLELEPADLGLDHNFLTFLQPAKTNSALTPQTFLIQSSGMSGVHIADPALGRVVLFSEATNAAPPSGPLTYNLTSAARVLNMVCDLAPGTRYALETSQSGGGRSVKLTPDVNGSLQTSSQGVLTFLIDDSPKIERPVLLSGARFSFRIVAPSSSTCLVQTATSLTGAWTNLAGFTNTVFPVNFTNQLNPGELQRFYRLLLVGP